MNKKLITIAIILFTLIATSNVCARSGNLRAGEFLIDTNIVYVPAAGDQSYPAIATDDTTAFVVWSDRRSGTAYDIYGSRIDEDGNILDPAGILIAHGSHNDPYPAVEFDGTNYLVVWGYGATIGQYDIYGMRVSKQGELLDPEPFVISDATGGQQSPAVAFDGTNYLVVWYDSRSGLDDIYCTRVTPNGNVLNPAGIAICTAAEYQFFPDVSFDGTNYMVVWQDQRNGAYDIYGTRVNQSGVVKEPSGILISDADDDQNRPSIDFDGTNYFVAWDDGRTSSAFDIYGTRIDTGGNVLNASGIAISTATDIQSSPSVSFDGTNYLVTWHDRRDGSDYDIYGARVNTSGVVHEPTGIHISGLDVQQLTPTVVSYSGQWLVAWRDNRNGGYTDIYGSRISASGTVTDTDGILIASSAQAQGKPAVSSDGTNYLVVWEENRGGGPPFDIYGMRVDASGKQLDEDAIPISTSTGSQQYPAVAFDNDSIYLVVWQDDRSGTNDIYGARVSTSGNVLDPPGIAISTATGRQQFPSVASDGTNFLVVWGDERGGSSSTDDIYGTLVEPDGNVVSPSGNVIADDANWQDNPSVAFDGTNYLVVWGDYGSGTWEEDIYGVRVNQSGNPVDASSFAISTASKGQWFPVVAFDGTNYMVVWFDKRTNNSSDIYGTRVNQSGTVLDAAGTPIIPYSGTQEYPFIVFDGTNYLVGCENYQSESVQNVLGAVVNTSGTVSEIYTISPFSIDQYMPNPAAANGEGSQILIVFPDWADEINGNPANALRIWGKIRMAAGIDENENITAKNGKFDLKTSAITQGICNITFVHSASTPVTLKIFNTAGILLNERIVGNSAGAYDLNIDMNNLPNGTYFFNVSSNDLQETEKAVLVK
ncbi:T9SS type A sorting domain-containing protein [candidate division WOR-3 bacterium]|nr:T9SS type A sorting domain-containing protein [candidate division WOR-3 bacterium]